MNLEKTLERTRRTYPYIFLILINLIVFYKYWLGISTPPWDFLGGGMVEQYRFYKDGGFFSPPSWFPYAWFGIPEYQMVQDGGWFIPVWITAETFGWHPANAARVQALLVLFSAIGMYKLSFTFVKSKYLATIAGTLYLFIPVFYSNAQHYSSVRSAAFLPWVLFFIHPENISKTRISIFLGSLVIFQTITGSYPGNLIATFYTVLIYFFVVCIFSSNNKYQYLKSLSIMSLAGISMGLIRYLPVIQLQETFPSDVGNQAGVRIYNLAYLIFPFIGKDLPYEDPTLRSIYIGSFALAVIFYLNYKNKKLIPWLTLFIMSTILMLSNTLNTGIREIIPFLNISRFAITDWRNTFNLSVIMIVILTMKYIQDQKVIDHFKTRILALATLLVFISITAYQSGQSIINLAFYSILTIIFFFYFKKISIKSNLSKSLTLVLISSSAVLFVFQNSFSWMTTVKEQNFNIYNNTFTNVFEYVKYPLKSRPARVSFLPTPLTPENYKNDQRYNRFWLTGGFGAFGYHNIKDIESYSALFPRLEKESDPVVNFLLAKGKQVITDGNQNLEQKLTDCTASISCPNDLGIEVAQQVFDKEREVFKIKSERSFTMIQNEIYSPIWSGTVCDDLKCDSIATSSTLKSLRTWDLPPGDYLFTTEAKTPLNNQRLILFWFGLSIALLSTARRKSTLELMYHRQ